MNLVSQINEIKKKFSGQILFNENLSKFSWFNLGGPAKVIFKPKNLNELSFFLKNLKGPNKIKILGAGSNTIIRDKGFDGIVIKFGKSFSHLSMFDHNTINQGRVISIDWLHGVESGGVELIDLAPTRPVRISAWWIPIPKFQKPLES